jgi:hypothetical protein
MSDETLSSAAGVLIESSISSGNIKGFGTTFAALTSGTHNFGFGVDVLKLLTTGSYNLGLGNLSLDALTTGSNCIAIGYNAVSAATTVSALLGIGVGALAANTSGTKNLGIGHNALTAVTTGASNTGVGYLVASTLTTGSNNTFFGADIVVTAVSRSGCTLIGAGATDNTADNEVHIYANNARYFYIDANKTIVAQGRVSNKAGASVASANDLALGTDGNYFNITGTTTINGIATSGWISGSVINLKFAAAVTVKHNTAATAGFARMFLAGSVDLSAAANTMLTLLYDGTQWQEISRKVA